MGCGRGLAQTLLVLGNFVIALVALSLMALCTFTAVHTFNDFGMLKKMVFLVVVLVAFFLLIMSILGCCAAMAEKRKRCARLIYILLVLMSLAIMLAGSAVAFNVGSVLERAKDKDVDISGSIDKATSQVLHFLHDQVGNLYTDGECKGGRANSTTFPIGFSEVHCSNKQIETVFSSILEQTSIATEDDLKNFLECVRLPAYTSEGQEPSSATEVYCDAENYIVSLADKNMQIVRWIPVALAVFTLLLLIAAFKVTCCVRESRDVRRADYDSREAQLAQRQRLV